MSADIVKCVDVSVTISNKYELETSRLISELVTCVGESHFVCGEKPFFGEYRPSFKLVHFL